jgi:nitrogen fixation NifU-like protein
MDFYDPIIIEYNKRKKQYEKRPEAQFCIEAYNPICGDAFKIYMDMEGAMISRASFSGYGCAVSKAASSLLVEKLEGVKRLDAVQIIEEYLTMVESGEVNKTGNKKWNAFVLAGKYPGRKKCATLSWDALRDFLKKRD